tara:strand:+ start:619 stop:3201 length:2583 start_codon:yes stop_codon:yes gene_type:complete
MTQQAQESYYESLGRQTQYPFQGQGIAYMEVEPDLTKAVNENIDKEIQDTAQFFSDNATNFNLTRQAASGRWRDLASLTKDGKTIIENWQNYSDELTNLQKLKKLNKDKAWKTQFDSEGIDLEKETGRNIVDLNKELGKAKASIDTLGYYDTVDENDKPIRIYQDNYKEYALLISSLQTNNGRGTANEAERHYDEWIRVAKKSLVHAETGLFWKDLDYSQKLEWKESADALYVQMWRQKDPNLSDRLIIKKLLPKFETKDTSLFSGQSSIDNDATEYVLGENSKMQGWSVIRSMSNSITRNNSYSVKDNIVTDEFFGEGGWYQTRLGFNLGRFNGDTKAARDATNKELQTLLDQGINSGMINEQHLDNVFTEWNYEKSDGSGLTTFMDMNNDSKKILLGAINTLEAKKKGDDKVRAQTLLNKHIKDLERGKFMTIEDRNFFAAYPELYPQAENIYNIGQKGGINNPVYAEANFSLNEAFKKRAGDKKHYPNIPDLGKDKSSTLKDAIIANNYQFLKARGTRYFLEQIENLEQTMSNEEEINRIALDRTIKALEEGKFDDAINNAIGDIKQEDPKEVLIRNSESINKDHIGWLKNTDYHFGEEIYAFQGEDFLLYGGPAPALYRQLEKLYPNLNIKNVIYERLVALKQIDPADERFAAYSLRASKKTNILESRLLTHYPDKSPALRYAIVNSENWKEAFKDIENPNSLEHFDGTGAFKVDGEFSKTIDLREIPIVAAGDDQAIFKLALDNPDAEFGKYRIKGRQLTTLLQYMANNDLLKDGQQFNENFEKALIFKALKFDSNDRLKWSGDTSYLGMFELSEEDQALFDKLTGEGGENIPEKFNNLQYLIKVLVNEELNTKL